MMRSIRENARNPLSFCIYMQVVEMRAHRTFKYIRCGSDLFQKRPRHIHATLTHR